MRTRRGAGIPAAFDQRGDRVFRETALIAFDQACENVHRRGAFLSAELADSADAFADFSAAQTGQPDIGGHGDAEIEQEFFEKIGVECDQDVGPRSFQPPFERILVEAGAVRERFDVERRDAR